MNLSLLILILFVAYSGLFAFLMVALESQKHKKYYILAKTINSFGFIAIALICGIITGHEKWLLILLPAFLLCFCGDVLLGFYQRLKKQLYFITGLLSFLCGHIFFVYAFSTRRSLTLLDCIFPVCVALLTFALTFLKDMDTGKMKPAIVVYAFFVALLLGKSAHLWIMSSSIQNWLLLIGSALFLISDALILFLYFYKKKHPIIHILNLGTYYYGMFFLSINLLF
ncbi:lysoplasmalogenase family protein [Paludicola sp. MB14-C6]|uniref:lysoplasmalogenase family protein n=1 Tax=Paludihabitans sp. MB14-C6 TaxID=3070656 RepID=UPI0027DACCB6|nr:lysoplasmalogenase family protein [Paludicola sp. MB14-C6]WMJ22151.1 lysoplasmalogenase family protein [Paludicola sp. MB14-C6]